VVDESPNGEYAGWTKGRNKTPSNLRNLVKGKVQNENMSSQDRLFLQSPFSSFCLKMGGFQDVWSVGRFICIVDRMYYNDKVGR
jgi:hypothetical protein